MTERAEAHDLAESLLTLGYVALSANGCKDIASLLSPWGASPATTYRPLKV